MSAPEKNPDDPITPDEAEAKPSPREKPMGFWEHLEELRGTLIKSVVVFVIFAVLIGIFLKEFNEALMWPLRRVQGGHPEFTLDLYTVSIMEIFNVIIQMCVFGGLVLASPFILFFIGQFVAPALTEREMKAVLPLCGSALVLFLLGAAFGFFLLTPSTIEVSLELHKMFGFGARWTPGNYFSLLTWLVVGVGATFEFPIVVVVLVWLGILTTATLRKYRRHAIVVIFIIAAIVTPTPDPFTQTIFAIPLYILFEIAVLVSSRIEKRKSRTVT